MQLGEANVTKGWDVMTHLQDLQVTTQATKRDACRLQFRMWTVSHTLYL